MFRQFGVVPGRAESGREGYAGGQRVLHLLGHAKHHGRTKNARSDRHVTDAIAGEITRDWQRHTHDATLGSTVGSLTNLAVVGGNRGGRDHDAALPGGFWFVLAHRVGR